ncbi:hypothetical protein Cs7R123_17050 [Catellatospora sp. TT07R-123]|uniref:ABC transporter permease n=1 Tax=Catellatospora sp. TT07R-123 TaxID=2733863 RepID=UPI001B2D274D|nr:ABC transporter permease [Catellatospora sp. TT07R-123]GHJ44363.1 hypothetical protein Cs7R123_17050 [Catellatospora sp. TT07R-123]
MVFAGLSYRRGRALALLLGVLLAATGFTVLTGATQTARLQVSGAVAEHARGAYEILVRPSGSRTALERDRGLVRPNFLAGQYGGIEVDQWRRVQRLPGVEVAAPIAMLGYGFSWTTVSIDVTDSVDRSKSRQLIQVRPLWQADSGLTNVEDPLTNLVYVTTQPLAWPSEPVTVGTAADTAYTDGTRKHTEVQCFDQWWMVGPPYERQSDGRWLPLCPNVTYTQGVQRRAQSVHAQLNADGSFTVDGARTDRLRATVLVPLPMLVAGIDPAAEAELVGLDRAIVAGRYLKPDEKALPFAAPECCAMSGRPMPPVLVAAAPNVDDRVAVRTEQVALGDRIVAGRTFGRVAELERLPTIPGTSRTSAAVAAVTGYDPRLWDGAHSGTGMPIGTELLRQIGPVDYDEGPGGVLAVRTGTPAVRGWGTGQFDAVPMLATDTGFRPVRAVPRAEVLGALVDPVVVGVFDRDRLTTGDGLAGASLETYLPVSAQAGDARTAALLGGQPLRPDTNPGGYLATSPSVLVALDTILPGRTAPAPISAIRVRVAGLHGFDAVSREKVRQTAEDIAAATGLDVDIVYGSSLAPQTVALPPGSYGRPALTLAEPWSRKGVAVALIEAADRKSVVLFGLILLVCVLFVGNAVAAAVRERRRELAVLACLGWSRGRLAALVAGEAGAIALLAGLVAVPAALGVGRLAGIAVPLRQALLAVPVALALALVAAAIPVARAARAHPAGAVHPAVAAPGRRAGRRRGLAGLAAANLRRMPGRTALGVLALAVGVAGTTMVAAVTWVFHGTATGTLLGDAVSLRVRPVDTLAVAATVLLGLAAVGDVLYLGVRDRAAELATLRATGWSRAATARLIAYEAAGIGLLGALLGAGGGLLGAAWFAGSLPAALPWTALAVGGAAVVLAVLASLVPALLQQRAPMSIILAEE